jgi:hypothetical protein
MNLASEYLIWLLVAHLVADWLLQNDWMAKNKSSLKHPAAWIHGAIHLVGAGLIVPLPFAALVAITHVLLDTRKPLQWWRRICRYPTEGEAVIHVTFWRDQTAHILILAVVALLAG